MNARSVLQCTIGAVFKKCHHCNTGVKLGVLRKFFVRIQSGNGKQLYIYFVSVFFTDFNNVIDATGWKL